MREYDNRLKGIETCEVLVHLVLSFFMDNIRRGDSSGDGGVGVVRVNFVGGYGCGEYCGLFG